jgi:hypothetical protein
MIKKFLFTAAVFIFTVAANAQVKPNTHHNRFVDFAATVGSSQGTVAGAYVYNWKLGKKQKWEAGLGLRWTSYFGTKTTFITAPAKLARTNTTPFLIFFAGQKTETQDTLTVQRPFTNSLNISANFGYNFSSKWSGGFNIDLIGFTVGRKSSATLTHNGATQNESEAKPAAFNVLLTGDHDRGSLNSEFFLKYKLNEKWGIKAVYEFVFVEYKTTTIKQQEGNITNDRFRLKGNTFGLGVSYNF